MFRHLDDHHNDSNNYYHLYYSIVARTYALATYPLGCYPRPNPNVRSIHTINTYSAAGRAELRGARPRAGRPFAQPSRRWAGRAARRRQPCGGSMNYKSHSFCACLRKTGSELGLGLLISCVYVVWHVCFLIWPNLERQSRTRYNIRC